jgi:hypothetical protein
MPFRVHHFMQNANHDYHIFFYIIENRMRFYIKSEIASFDNINRFSANLEKQNSIELW